MTASTSHVMVRFGTKTVKLHWCVLDNTLTREDLCIQDALSRQEGSYRRLWHGCASNSSVVS